MTVNITCPGCGFGKWFLNEEQFYEWIAKNQECIRCKAPASGFKVHKT